MAGVVVRIAEAEAALVTLDEAIGKSTRSLLERDGAILRVDLHFRSGMEGFVAAPYRARGRQCRCAKRHDPRGPAG